MEQWSQNNTLTLDGHPGGLGCFFELIAPYIKQCTLTMHIVKLSSKKKLFKNKP